MDQQPADGLQLLGGLLGVRVAEALLAGVLLQVSHVVDRVVRQAPEDLDHKGLKVKRCMLNTAKTDLVVLSCLSRVSNFLLQYQLQRDLL